MQKEENVVPVTERNLTPKALFYNWFAANIGIMGFVYGAIIVSYHLSLAQALLAALIGALSFVFPGFIAVIGQKNGITTFKLSRVAFGRQGNKIPNLIAWFNMVGWLAVNVVTGTLLFVAMLQTLHLPKNSFTILGCLVVFGGLIIGSGFLNETLLAKLQSLISWIFGIATLIIFLFFVGKTQWPKALAMTHGSWSAGFWPAVSIIAAGSGISWSMAAADWGAYVQPQIKHGRTFWSTTLGGALPLFILMVGGIFLSTSAPNLATSSDPYRIMYGVLPTWMGLFYFLVAAGGLVPQCMISFRSARINLQTLGIKTSQLSSLILHSLLVLGIASYVLFVAQDFLSSFELFLNFLGICLVTWLAVFLCDYLFYRRQGYDLALLQIHYRWRSIIVWLLATSSGLLFTNNAVWQGPFARGVFRDNSLGVFVAGFFALFLMGLIYLIDQRYRK
ncbi:purine-cytosine permease family protein [Bombilactobacillus thymidiniphilus]|uniref:Cytosine permease n=1 Tax=Bombilactobacillus thymidiniphilus TaxID=2923363 RepID=A0ABY4PF86_9LACO|nr:cytosine permease [Bombilactobacillus thymidiniphilus]UQS84240.1 cytosine permease [Bombilactobacillus thymidiniphilus]